MRSGLRLRTRADNVPPDATSAVMIAASWPKQRFDACVCDVVLAELRS